MTTTFNVTINAYSGSIVNICGNCCGLTGSCFVTCSMEQSSSIDGPEDVLGLLHLVQIRGRHH